MNTGIGKRHRARLNRVLARKSSGAVLADRFQKEIDKLTSEDLNALGINDGIKELHWVCAKCNKPKEHQQGCEFHPAFKVQTKTGGRQLSIFQALNLAVQDRSFLAGTEVSDSEQMDRENEQDQSFTARTARTTTTTTITTTTTTTTIAATLHSNIPVPIDPNSNDESQSARLSDYAHLFFVNHVRPLICDIDTGRIDRNAIAERIRQLSIAARNV